MYCSLTQCPSPFCENPIVYTEAQHVCVLGVPTLFPFVRVLFCGTLVSREVDYYLPVRDWSESRIISPACCHYFSLLGSLTEHSG